MKVAIEDNMILKHFWWTKYHARLIVMGLIKIGFFFWV